MAQKRKATTDRARHNEVLRSVSRMRRDAGVLAESALYENWPPVTVAWLYRLYDVLAEFETQARNLEDQGQLPF